MSLIVEVNRIPSREELGFTGSDPRQILATRQAVRDFIVQTTTTLGITVEETDRPEPGHSGPLRPSFEKELQELREAVPDLPIPHTVSFADFCERPFFPAVAKKRTSSRGKNKFLLGAAGQWDKFQQWAAHHNQGELPDWVFQQFFECPSERRTSYRVLVDCLGRIIAAQLMYGPKKRDDPRVQLSGNKDPKAEPEDDLRNPESPFFLNARDVSSNLVFVDGSGSGCSYEGSLSRRDGSYEGGYWCITGGRITLNRRPQSHPISDYERQLLEAHGINPRLPRLPKKIADMSSAIGRHCGKKGDRIRELWLGLDWIQDETGNIYFLEKNHRPNLVSLRDLEGSAEAISEMQAMRWLIEDVLGAAAEQYS